MPIRTVDDGEPVLRRVDEHLGSQALAGALARRRTIASIYRSNQSGSTAVRA